MDLSISRTTKKSPIAGQPVIPDTETVSWPELCALLTAHAERAQKDGPMWSPASYEPGISALAANVLAVSCFVLDFDHGVWPESLAPLWEAFTYCVHSSHSHTAEHPRWRAVFPLAAPVPGPDWYGVWEKLVHHMAGGCEIDRSCKEPNRRWWLPSCPPGAPRFARVHSGSRGRLDPSVFEDLPRPERAVFLPGASRLDAAVFLDRALREKVPQVGRNCAGFWLAGQLRDHDYSLPEAEQALLDFRDRCPATNLKGEVEAYTEREALHNVRSAWRRPKREPWGAPVPVEAGQKGGMVRAPARRKPAPRPPDDDPGPSLSPEEEAAEPLAPFAPAEGPGKNGDTPTPNEKELGQQFALDHQDRLMTTDGGAWWRYDAGLWRTLDRQAVLRAVDSLLDPLVPGRQYARLLEAVTKIAGIRLHVPLARLNANPNRIALRNGVYDVEEGRWLEHSPSHLLTVQLPYDYAPGATCPRWEAFLGQMVVDESGKTSESMIRIIQEFFGYCLIPDSRAQTSLWWTGGGANGKGVATKILEALVGERQRGGVSIENLDNEYHVAALHGKLLGIVGEIPLRAMLKNGQRFKEIVSGDSISGRHPRGEVFTFVPTIRMLVTANDLPKAADRTFGYFRRLLIIPWRVILPEERQDKELLEKLMSELPGIFNWALEGLYRLQAQRLHFTESADVRQAMADYQHEQDPVAQFLDDWCSRDDPEREESFSELWDAFRRWCKVNGQEAENTTAFGRALSRHGLSALVKKVEGRTVRVRKGVTLLIAGYETSYGTV